MMVNILERFRGRNKELETQDFRFVSLIDIMPHELKQMRKKVRKEAGQITILVHPFYNQDEPSDYFPLSSEYRDQLNNYLKEALETGTPVIIFEQHSAVVRLQERLSENKGVIYIVPTLPKTATPWHDIPRSSTMVARVRRQQVWNDITRTLIKAGVKSASVGGRYMILHEVTNDNGASALRDLDKVASDFPNAQEWIKKRLIPGGCPGEVIWNLLSAQIDVSISPFSSPTSSLSTTDLSLAPDTIRRIY